MSEFDHAAFDRKKREIEILLDEYEAAIGDYAAFMAAWRARQRGFRAQRRQPAPQGAAE